jgi:hypothetical protein
LTAAVPALAYGQHVVAVGERVDPAVLPLEEGRHQRVLITAQLLDRTADLGGIFLVRLPPRGLADAEPAVLVAVAGLAVAQLLGLARVAEPVHALEDGISTSQKGDI